MACNTHIVAEPHRIVVEMVETSHMQNCEKTQVFVKAQRSRPGHRGVGGVGVATKSLQITGVQESGTESKTESSYGGTTEGPNP